jgi:outer membrane protein OmpA-like peptidoglycan-associated protein
MRNKFILVGLMVSLAVTPAFAESSPTEEKVGVGLGAVVGAVAGGPVGAIIGAAFGAKIGDGYNQRNERVDSLTASLHGSETRVGRLEGDIRALNGQIAGLDGEVERLRETSNPELVSLLQAGIAMDLLFRTDEDVLAEPTGSKLQHLAGTLATMHDVQIQLDGFADARGDATYNQALSARRAEHVRDVLLASGIPPARIRLNAHGEAPATDANIDSFAFDRKVSLTLYVTDSNAVASNPL